jgi:beta-alanine degradation protein BauB
VELDPVVTNPEHYAVLFENDEVRVLEYNDQPGDRTTPHDHPDSVMYSLSHIRRRLVAGDQQRDVDIPAGTVNWVPAQRHSGENTGDTPSRAIFVELKRTGSRSGTGTPPDTGTLGPG